MAVTFSKEGFTITVKENFQPECDWRMMCESIIDVLGCNKDGSPNDYYYLLELLREMLPDEEQIKRLKL